MTSTFTTQALQELLAFPFRGPDAKRKFLVGGLLGLAGFIVPIVPGIFLVGYGGLIMRRIINEKGEPYLPEWENWNEMLMLGLRMSGAMLVYAFPMLLVLLVSYLGMLAPAFLAVLSDPYSSHEVRRMLGLQMLGTFGGMCGFGIGILLAAALWFIIPPMLGHVVARNSFAAAFRVREWWRILRANWGGFIVAMILMAGLYMGLVMFAQVLYMTLVLCVVVPFLLVIIGVYVMIIAYTLFAQAYVEAVAKLEAESPHMPLPARSTPA